MLPPSAHPCTTFPLWYRFIGSRLAMIMAHSCEQLSD